MCVLANFSVIHKETSCKNIIHISFIHGTDSHSSFVDKWYNGSL